MNDHPSGLQLPEGFDPFHPILAGIETEYGFTVEGHGAEDQIDDAVQFVSLYPDSCWVGWNYKYESPRADLRGFNLEKLAVDPDDANFDQGRSHALPHEIRSDRILPNGARFYNDHGHPEYATPECWSLNELMNHDKAGEIVLRRSGFELETRTERKVTVYKNNTDFHGASYGTHESYLVPRCLGFERLYAAVTPILIARQILTGAGKVGSEKGAKVPFQISARADFFSESANAETLYRRPVFNTRDEPHADPEQWIRLHVISGDANMIPSCTSRKVGLVKLALHLAMMGVQPSWHIENPVAAFQQVSRDDSFKFQVDLKKGSWTNAYEILESYFTEYEKLEGFHQSPIDGEFCDLIAKSRILMEKLQTGDESARNSIDWMAKKYILETYLSEENSNWNDPALQAYDLEYHNIDPDEGLYFALAEMNEVESYPPLSLCLDRLIEPIEHNRAWARSIALKNFPDQVAGCCWRKIDLKTRDDRIVSVDLDPYREYPAQLAQALNVENYISCLSQ